MYYQNYEDYMRSVLGYPTEASRSTYDEYYPYSPQERMVEMPYQNRTAEMEQWYPEIYRVLEPIVSNACDNCREPMSREVLERLTDEVYEKASQNNAIRIHISIENRGESAGSKEIENRNVDKKTTSPMNSSLKTNPSKMIENRAVETETRQRRPENPLLRDLIRILILQRLLGGNFPGRPPMRPPFPGGPRPPMRPPFPGGPERPPRPQPRDFEDYLKY